MVEKIFNGVHKGLVLSKFIGLFIFFLLACFLFMVSARVRSSYKIEERRKYSEVALENKIGLSNTLLPVKPSGAEEPDRNYLEVSSGISKSPNPTGQVRIVQESLVDRGLPHVGSISMEILAQSQDLREVMSLHWAAVRLPEQEISAQKWLSSKDTLQKWEALLLAPYSVPLEIKQILTRAYAIDALSQAVKWKQNPLRKSAFDAFERVLTSTPSPSIDLAASRAIATEKAEVWTYLKQYSKDEPKMTHMKKMAIINWAKK